MTVRGFFLTGALVAWMLPQAARAAGLTPLLQPGKHSLYQRVITRPGATMAADETGTAAKPVDGFEVFYVFARRQDRIQVGDSVSGPALGWIEESRTIPWPHTMIATFTNPAGRNRVLFLDTPGHEQDLLTAPDSGARAAALLRDAQAGKPGPVIAIEPENYVDIKKNFYLLPVLDATVTDRDSGPSVHMLHVISAPAAGTGTQPLSSPEALRQFRAGLVFVIDTTASMQPYIDQTRAAIGDIIHTMQNTAVARNFRFGLVAYRDSLSDTPGLEYATKVYATPDLGRPIDAILPAISGVHDASVSSSSFDEDAVAGVRSAIDSVNWDQFGGRYLVLITDAGARGGDDPHSLTHLGIDEARQLAAAKGIALFVVHLLTPAGDAAHDHAHAASQYRALSKFGSAGSLYYPVAGGAPEAFRPVVQSLSTSLLQQVADTTGRPVAGLTPRDAKPDPKTAVVSQAMRLAYLGRAQNTAAPDVVQSYTADRDPADALRKSVDIRVLLTRNQLSDLAASLRTILDAGLAGRTTPETFFTQLQSAFAASARDPSAIRHVDRIGPLLGEYLDGLPYKSDIASITQDSWLAMGAIAQRTILNNIASRLRLYEEFDSRPELWVHLDHAQAPGEAVYPVPLEALP
ncbi:VWA domain-containing protein [Gluconacetobacter sp. 1b LMG 1731]|uniref:VWA domain-containing protein n=1 Tax=Gluconacetobacter dulcium TaxID=2729096 RepID=A0A7W4NXI9_9PROT|nr:vWA domain-containing protein [Gluconacetobacter dulcium]MBB2166620.1 VWA domain-containing protein [Gluconacetobacter dulcium]MBB2195719.1 VWA domain-containing protein [Gluconacetobacter dulcium]